MVWSRSTLYRGSVSVDIEVSLHWGFVISRTPNMAAWIETEINIGILSTPKRFPSKRATHTFTTKQTDHARKVGNGRWSKLFNQCGPSKNTSLALELGFDLIRKSNLSANWNTRWTTEGGCRLDRARVDIISFITLLYTIWKSGKRPNIGTLAQVLESWLNDGQSLWRLAATPNFWLDENGLAVIT